MENSYLTDRLKQKIETAEEFNTPAFEQVMQKHNRNWSLNPRSFFAEVAQIINKQVLEIVWQNTKLLKYIWDPEEIDSLEISENPSEEQLSKLKMQFRGRKWIDAATLKRAWETTARKKTQDKKINVLLVFLKVRRKNWHIYKQPGLPLAEAAQETAHRLFYYYCFIAYKNRISRALLRLNFGTGQARMTFWRKNPDSPSSIELNGEFSHDDRILQVNLLRSKRYESHINACLDDGNPESLRPIPGVYSGLDFINPMPITGGIWIQRIEGPNPDPDAIPYPQTIPPRAAWHLANTFREMSYESTFSMEQEAWIRQYAGSYELYHVVDTTTYPALQRSLFGVNPDFSVELHSVSGFRYTGVVHFVMPKGVMLLRFTSLHDPQHAFQVVMQPGKDLPESGYLWGVYSGIDEHRSPEAGRAVAFRTGNANTFTFLRDHSKRIVKIPLRDLGFSGLMQEHPLFQGFFAGNTDDFIEPESLFRAHLHVHVEERVLGRLPTGWFDLYLQAGRAQIRRYLLRIDPDGQTLFWGEFEHRGLCNIRSDCLELFHFEQNGDRAFEQLLFFVGNLHPRQVQSMVGIRLALSHNASPVAQKCVLIRRNDHPDVALASLPTTILMESEAFSMVNQQYPGLCDYLMAEDGPLTTPREVNLGIDRPFEG